ncbi:MAG: hypothetical protein U1G07_01850 [Verrucomicrobiota bacterium]
MRTPTLPAKLKAIDAWRNRTVYRARIVNTETAEVVVKSARVLKVGKRISFAKVSDFEGPRPQNWRSAVIWRIEKDCLHLTRT